MGLLSNTSTGRDAIVKQQYHQSFGTDNVVILEKSELIRWIKINRYRSKLYFNPKQSTIFFHKDCTLLWGQVHKWWVENNEIIHPNTPIDNWLYEQFSKNWKIWEPVDPTAPLFERYSQQINQKIVQRLNLK